MLQFFAPVKTFFAANTNFKQKLAFLLLLIYMARLIFHKNGMGQSDFPESW